MNSKNSLFSYVKLLVALAVSALSSCTLYMDDIDMPADLRGFKVAETLENDMGTFTYQFNDNVKSIADNVLPYISHVEADSIVYYLDTTPADKLPRVGELLSARLSSKIRKGLNHRVLSVENIGGLYKVVTTKAELNDVYKVFKIDYDFDVAMPTINAIDSTDMVEQGLTQEDLEYTYWEPYNKERPEDPIIEGSTRADDGVDVTRNVELNILDINVKSDEEASYKYKVLNTIKNSIGNKIPGNLQLVANCKYVIPVNIKLKADFSIIDGFFLDLKVTEKPYIDFKGGIGVSAINMGGLYNEEAEKIEDVSLVQTALDKLFTTKKNNKQKFSPVLPRLNWPLGASGLFLIIEPRVGVNMNLSVLGTFEKVIYFDETVRSFVMEGGSIVKDKTYTKSNPSPYSSPLTFGLAGSFGASVSAGVGFGISLFGVSDVQLTGDIDAGIFAEANLFETTDFSGVGHYITNLDAYTPTKNYAEFKADLVAGVQLKVAKKKWNWEIGRLNVLRYRQSLFPEISDFVIEHKYNPETNLICGGTAHVTMGNLGLFPHRYMATNIGVAVKPRSSDENPTKLVMDVPGSLTSGKTYTFDYSLPENMDGYEICPMLNPTFGRDVVINGTPVVAIGNANGFEVKSHKMRLNCSHKVGYINNKSLKQYVEKKFPKVNNLQNYYYYNWSDDIEIVGGPNVAKWGVRVSIGVNKDYTSQTLLEKDYIIEDSNDKAIFSGKKSVMFDFIDSWIPNTGDESIAPYHVSVRPFYYDDAGVRHQLHAKSLDINIGAQYPSVITEFSGTKVSL